MQRGRKNKKNLSASLRAKYSIASIQMKHITLKKSNQNHLPKNQTPTEQVQNIKVINKHPLTKNQHQRTQIINKNYNQTTIQQENHHQVKTQGKQRSISSKNQAKIFLQNLNSKAQRKSFKRIYSRLNKTLQFDKEKSLNKTLVHPNNSYLVTGIKNQYQKLKKDYNQKCQQLDKLRKITSHDKQREIQLYIEKLEKQNIRLLAILSGTKKIKNNQTCYQKQKQQKRSYTKDVILRSTQKTRDDQDLAKFLAVQKQMVEILQLQVKSLKKKKKQQQKEILNLNAKIIILSKLVNKYENKQHREKQEEKIKKKRDINSKQIIQKLQDQISSLTDKFSKDKQEIIENCHQKCKSVESTFIRQISYLKEKCEMEMKKNRYLENLIQTWKVDTNQKLEEQKEETNKNNSSKFDKYQQNQLKNLERIQKNQEIQKNQHYTLTQNNAPESKLIQQTQKQSFIQHQQPEECHDHSQIQKNLQKSNNQQSKIRKANCKRSGSKKMRPIQQFEIIPILNFLILKLAYLQTSAQTIKHFFSFQHQKQSNPKTIVTVREVYNIFREIPFNLSEEQAQVLARYIVEDVKQPYIYMHWQNQQQLIVVRSIVANLLGRYELFKPQIKEKAEDLLQRYGSNILPALKTVTGRTGKISQQKFFEVLDGLGLQRQEEMDKYFVGKMAVKSLDLKDLQFSHLFAQ